MKLIVTMILLSTVASAQVVKTCKTVLPSLDESVKPVPSTFEIFKRGNKLEAKITQVVEGRAHSYKDVAEAFEGKVRSGLAADSHIEKLNLAESLVVHAMSLEEPEFEGRFKSGINLKKIRSAKVIVVGKPTNMGATSIVEAKDAKGKVLGSFLGGFLVSPCK